MENDILMQKLEVIEMRGRFRSMKSDTTDPQIIKYCSKGLNIMDMLQMNLDCMESYFKEQSNEDDK